MGEEVNFLEALKNRFTSIPEGLEPERGDISVRCPHVWECLCRSSYAPGKPRQTGSVTIFPDGGTVTVILHLREEGVKVYAESVSLEGVWDALEERIKTDPRAFKETPEARKKKLAALAAKKKEGPDNRSGQGNS